MTEYSDLDFEYCQDCGLTWDSHTTSSCPLCAYDDLVEKYDILYTERDEFEADRDALKNAYDNAADLIDNLDYEIDQWDRKGRL